MYGAQERAPTRPDFLLTCAETGEMLMYSIYLLIGLSIGISHLDCVDSGACESAGQIKLECIEKQPGFQTRVLVDGKEIRIGMKFPDVMQSVGCTPVRIEVRRGLGLVEYEAKDGSFVIYFNTDRIEFMVFYSYY